MQHDDEKIVNAKRPKLDAQGQPKAGQYDERQFTGTQWEAMGKDKSGWQVAAPSEAAKIDPKAETPDPAKTAAEVALLNARERYEALFERKPHHSTKVETLESQIAAELEKQNSGKGNTPPAGGALPPAGAGDATSTDGAPNDAEASDAESKAAGDSAVKKAEGAAE